MNAGSGTLILTFDIVPRHFLEQDGVVLLQAHEIASAGTSQAPSARFYQLLKAEKVVGEGEVPSFAVRRPGLYSMVAIGATGETRTTQAIEVTAGMVAATQHPQALYQLIPRDDHNDPQYPSHVLLVVEPIPPGDIPGIRYTLQRYEADTPDAKVIERIENTKPHFLTDISGVYAATIVRADGKTAFTGRIALTIDREGGTPLSTR